MNNRRHGHIVLHNKDHESLLWIHRARLLYYSQGLIYHQCHNDAFKNIPVHQVCFWHLNPGFHAIIDKDSKRFKGLSKMIVSSVLKLVAVWSDLENIMYLCRGGPNNILLILPFDSWFIFIILCCPPRFDLAISVFAQSIILWCFQWGFGHLLCCHDYTWQ